MSTCPMSEDTYLQVTYPRERRSADGSRNRGAFQAAPHGVLSLFPITCLSIGHHRCGPEAFLNVTMNKNDPSMLDVPARLILYGPTSSHQETSHRLSES
jgi:hypothetical protein